MNVSVPLNFGDRQLFGTQRLAEQSTDLFQQLTTDVGVFGVTPELVHRSLDNISAEDLIHALEETLQNQEQLVEIASRSSYHPNGFLKLQMVLERHAKVRLHYWPASMLSAEENIHNHRWRLASKVLLGQLTSEIFVESDHKEVGAQNLEMRMYRKQLGAHEAQTIHMGARFVKRSEVIIRSAGEAYYLDTDVMHRIIHKGGQATLTLMVQSAPIYQENHMLSLPHVEEPEVNPKKLSGPSELHSIMIELIDLLSTSLNQSEYS